MLVLIPLYVSLLALSAWLLYRSARVHDDPSLFWVGAGGAVVAFISLWISSFLVYAGLIVLVGANIGDFVRALRHRTA